MFPPPFELLECIDLFNILNAEINGLARISDTNYLYLLGLFLFSVTVFLNNLIKTLDCRSRKEYDESHIISANHIQRVSSFKNDLNKIIYIFLKNRDGQYEMPWHADLETREHVVLYDSRTNSLPLHEHGIHNRFFFLLFE